MIYSYNSNNSNTILKMMNIFVFRVFNMIWGYPFNTFNNLICLKINNMFCIFLNVTQNLVIDQ